MNLFIVFTVSILGGVCGLLLTGFISNACVYWYRIPAREGASGYFVVFTSLGGGLAGLVVSFITALVVAANFGPSFHRELGAAICVLLPIAIIATVICRLNAHISPTIDGRELNLEVEFRFPPGTDTANPPTADRQWWVVFDPLVSRAPHHETVTGEINNAAARLEDGRWIVPTTVHLFTQRGRRFVKLYKGASEETDGAAFTLPVPARPKKIDDAWSDWFPARQPAGQPWPAGKMSCRYRVQFVPPPPPPKTEAEQHAETQAINEAAFLALPADAPLPEWLRFVSYGRGQTERALQAIANRPNVVQEIETLAVGEHIPFAGEAIRCIARLPGPTDKFNAPMQRVGLHIAEQIRKLNALSAAQDPNDFVGSDVGELFTSWHITITVLREKSGGDFTPELKTILELSRVRTQSRSMKFDVCRVASYYLHQWAGIEPLPTNPKPS